MRVLAALDHPPRSKLHPLAVITAESRRSWTVTLLVRAPTSPFPVCSLMLPDDVAAM